MAKFSEETLNGWRMPPSESEETKLANAEASVKDAIWSDEKLKKITIDTFGQGSYANDTNVRLNSDVDINVRLADTIFVQLPEGKNDDDYGYTSSSYTFREYKVDVFNALVKKFGNDYVVRKDKCITVKANAYRVETDVVPTFKLIRHENNGSQIIGTKFITDSYNHVVNYPLQHIENGKIKNTATQKRFKRLTRIFRRIRYKMIEDNVTVSDNITSFLLECLVWNVPNNIFNDYDSWTERLRQAIIYLYQNTKDDDKCKEWGEVSELLYLFIGRKWSREDVNYFLIQMWNYLEFKWKILISNIHFFCY